MQTRHRRELVREPAFRVGAVHRLAHRQPGVDPAELRQHSRRREREQHVSDQRESGERGQGPTSFGVLRWALDEQPDQHDRGQREVHARVVPVGELSEVGDLQGERLDVGLARQSDPGLEVDQRVGVEEGGSGVLGGQEAAEVVDAEEHGEQEDFAGYLASS